MCKVLIQEIAFIPVCYFISLTFSPGPFMHSSLYCSRQFFIHARFRITSKIEIECEMSVFRCVFESNEGDLNEPNVECVDTDFFQVMYSV